MKIIKRPFTLALAAIFGAFTFQGTQAQMSAASLNEAELNQSIKATTPAPPTVVGVASSNEAFSTLVAALKAADLVSTLDGQGPFTVFAPTNDAFGKLPDGTVESLLQPENKPTLISILTYHVVSGKFMASDVVQAIKDNNNAFVVETVHGTPLTLSLKNGSVIITDAQGNSSKVTTTDVKASNGVIHVIDTVVLPE